MMKRRLKDFGLPLLYSPRSVRVTIITDLLEQNVPRETCGTWPYTQTPHHRPRQPAQDQ